ncbi:hypothetical protein PIB30_021242 [Stylosanthes scabra]|uniref:Uncharacterized protein n=1 Tax=Stylosanthes scabra TaxID=79078 RepID=A0ABU6W8H4_9FABA|nr:hypothetical protein [Stylosanthes scabra]
MAESFIFSIAESLVTKLASRAYQEASQVIGIYDDLQDLKTSLLYVKAVLLDAEQKQEHNHELREWLKQIKLIFYDAENLLDQLTVNLCASKCSRPTALPKTREIRKRLDKVAADRDKFGLQTIAVDRRVVHRREMTYSHVVESDVIGRDRDKEKIVKLLMEPSLDNNGRKHISVIPIVGIGGLGKTTLAKLVFNDERIKKSFPLKMWVCMSDGFDSLWRAAGREEVNNEDLLIACVSSCKYLRYLDLYESTFETLPGSISKLKHLRYLSLSNNRRIRRLPESICTLQNLEELHLRGCIELETLPKKIRNLISIRFMSITTKQSVLPEDDFAKLGLLEELDIYHCDSLESSFVGVKLPVLRRLRIKRCKSLKSLPLDTHHFPQLEQLVVDECDNFELSKVHEKMNSTLSLKTLFFSKVVNFPPSLQGYENTLQTLGFVSCYELETLPEWVLNMTSLKFLHIWSCPKLTSLPNDIHRLTTLEVLRIEDALNCTKNINRMLESIGTKYPTSSIVRLGRQGGVANGR